jgi:hypothetical protein
MVIQMMIQLIKHHPIIILLHRLSLRADAVILFREIAAEAAEPEYVVSIQIHTRSEHSQRLTSSYPPTRTPNARSTHYCQT